MVQYGQARSPGAEASQSNMQTAKNKFIFTLERQNTQIPL